MQRIPMSRFVRMKLGARIDDGLHERNAIGLRFGDGRKCAARPFAGDDNDAALACLIAGETPIAAALVLRYTAARI